MNRWICKNCDLMRKTPYCPECGEQKPKGKKLIMCISDLRDAAYKHRIQEQRLHNRIKTMKSYHSDWNIDKLEIAEKNHRRFADAIESAIMLLE